MNRKKISRLIAGALATSVVLNSSPSAVESVHAITKDIYSEFSEGHGLGDDAGENQTMVMLMKIQLIILALIYQN